MDVELNRENVKNTTVIITNHLIKEEECSEIESEDEISLVSKLKPINKESFGGRPLIAQTGQREISKIEIIKDAQSGEIDEHDGEVGFLSDTIKKEEDDEYIPGDGEETAAKKPRGKNPYKCSICGLRYRLKSQLAKHSEKHPGGKVIKCTQTHCRRRFTTEHNMKKHVAVRHAKVKSKIGMLNTKNLKADEAPLAKMIVMTATKVVESSKGKNFPCSVCGMDFKRNRDLFHHTLTHTGERPFVCELCGKDFPRKSGLNRHKLVHSTVKPFKCSDCNKAYAARDMLYHHYKVVHAPNRPYACEHCDKKFALQCLLKRHFLERHADKKFSCDICGKKYRTKREVRSHSAVHKNHLPEYECDKCDQIFLRRIDLIRHKRSHKTSTTSKKFEKLPEGLHFQCEHCGLGFATEKQREIHSKMHGPPITWFQCEICGVQYKALQALTRHHNDKHKNHVKNTFKFKVAIKDPEPEQPPPVKPHHRDREGNYQCLECGEKFQRHAKYYRHRAEHNPKKCDVCDKTFLFNYALKLHKRTHTGEKHYECVECNQKFAQQATLKRHKLLHSGVKPFQCEVCGHAFAQRGNYNKHKRSHAGEKIHQCDVCGKQFTQQITLEKHHLTHIEKYFQCLVCEKTFASKSGLNRHSAIHLEEKQHECTTCGKKFAQINNLKLHSLTHTGERPFECDHCGKKFARKGDLKKHFAIHTNEIYIQEAELELE